MLARTYAFRRIVAGYPSGWRALLHGFKIDARPADIAFGSTQRLSSDAAIRGSIGGKDAAFATTDDAGDWELRSDACCGVAGDIGGPFCGLTSLPADGPNHRTEACTDIGNSLLHPISERVEEALWL